MKFRRLASLSEGVSSDVLLLDRAANAETVGASIDDVFILSTLGRVVWTKGSAADALPSGMARIGWRF
jgi:hypothetical protein